MTSEHGPNAYSEIKEIDRARAAFPRGSKKKALAVFQRVAVAEGKIHGLPPGEVHFHEVGAVDSIVDIVGGCVGPGNSGQAARPGSAARWTAPAGSIARTAGFRSRPRPRWKSWPRAASPLTQCEEPHELITPTGAALLAEFAEEFGPMRGSGGRADRLGVGSRENKTRPNVLRAILGGMRRRVGARLGERHHRRFGNQPGRRQPGDFGPFCRDGDGRGRAGCFPDADPNEEKPPRRSAERSVRGGRGGQIQRDDPAPNQRFWRAPVAGGTPEIAPGISIRANAPRPGHGEDRPAGWPGRRRSRRNSSRARSWPGKKTCPWPRFTAPPWPRGSPEDTPSGLVPKPAASPFCIDLRGPTP